MPRRLAAEFLGTFWWVLGGCGTAVLAADPAGDLSVGVGHVGVALAFGLSVFTATYAFGPFSGGHFNPAVTLGAAAAGRVPWPTVPGYWLAQAGGGLLAGLMILLIGKGRPGWTATGNMAANGYGEHSPFFYSLAAVLITEVLLTFVVLLVFLSATDGRASWGFAGLAIGLALTAIHLVSMPVSNTSVNPARSTAVAFFNGAGAPGQLWAFWLAPLMGAALAGWLYPVLFGRSQTADPLHR